jgi:hypothetical protein
MTRGNTQVIDEACNNPMSCKMTIMPSLKCAKTIDEKEHVGT